MSLTYKVAVKDIEKEKEYLDSLMLKERENGEAVLEGYQYNSEGNFRVFYN